MNQLEIGLLNNVFHHFIIKNNIMSKKNLNIMPGQIRGKSFKKVV